MFSNIWSQIIYLLKQQNCMVLLKWFMNIRGQIYIIENKEPVARVLLYLTIFRVNFICQVIFFS